VPEDTPLIFTPLDFSNHFIDQDPEDVLVSVVIVTLPEKGSLLFGSTAIVAGQEISKGSLADVAFLPERDSNGTFSFKIRVSDGKDLSGTTSSVAIMILPVNDTPAFTIGSNLHESEDFTAPIIVKASPLPVPQDESSQTITYTLFPATSRLVSIELNAATGELRFASVLNEHGAEDFIITANDGQADNNVFSATIKVNILPVNDPPVLSVIPDQAVDFLGEMLPIAISVEDVDDPLASVVLSAKSDNTLVIKNEKITFSGEGVERQIHIDPEERRHGEVTISVSATDGKASALREFRVVLFTITSALDLPMGNLTVTPNPARHTVYVRSNASPDKPLVLVIKDALGRDILHEVISQHDASIDVRNLSSGMYLLTISGRHHRSRQIRLVKE
jgi:hypothetical protein